LQWAALRSQFRAAYAVDGLILCADHKSRVLSEHLAGLDLHLDMSRLEPADRLRVRTAFKEALAALDETAPPAAGS
jgi:adenylate cyclase